MLKVTKFVSVSTIKEAQSVKKIQNRVKEQSMKHLRIDDGQSKVDKEKFW